MPATEPPAPKADLHPDGVRFATSDADLHAAFQLRYQIYVEEMHRMGEKADHDAGILTDDMDKTARSIIAVKDGQCVATMRLHWGGDAPFADFLHKVYGVAGFEEDLTQAEMCIVERLMVVKSMRGDRRFTAEIYLFLYRFLIEQGVELVLLACEPHLINTWNKLGFRPFTSTFTDPRVGILIPLCGIVWDIDYLREMGSPLLLALESADDGGKPPGVASRAYAKLPMPVRYVANRFVLSRFMSVGDHGPVVEKLRARLAAQDGLVSEKAVGESEFAKTVTSTLEKANTGDYALFEDMTNEEVVRCLRSGHVLACKPEDVIVRKESVTRTLFLILEGKADVRKEGETLMTLQAGALIGEVAYILGVPRTADIIASGDCRVLTFSEGSLRDIEKKDTPLYAKLLRNICRCICRRMLN